MNAPRFIYGYDEQTQSAECSLGIHTGGWRFQTDAAEKLCIHKFTLAGIVTTCVFLIIISY